MPAGWTDCSGNGLHNCCFCTYSYININKQQFFLDLSVFCHFVLPCLFDLSILHGQCLGIFWMAHPRPWVRTNKTKKARNLLPNQPTRPRNVKRTKTNQHLSQAPLWTKSVHFFFFVLAHIYFNVSIKSHLIFK